MAAPQIPTIGRIVHVWSDQGMRWLPAIVTLVPKVGDPESRLTAVAFGVDPAWPAHEIANLPEWTQGESERECWRWPSK